MSSPTPNPHEALRRANERIAALTRQNGELKSLLTNERATTQMAGKALDVGIKTGLETEKQLSELRSQLKGLQGQHSDLQRRYIEVSKRHKELLDDYKGLLQNCLKEEGGSTTTSTSALLQLQRREQGVRERVVLGILQQYMGELEAASAGEGGELTVGDVLERFKTTMRRVSEAYGESDAANHPAGSSTSSGNRSKGKAKAQ